MNDPTHRDAQKPTPDSPRLDRLFLNARREAIVVLIAWLVWCVWVVGYCAVFAYEVDPATMKIVLGMPAWVFWGVALPWACATLFTIWFCFYFMADDSVDDPPPEDAP